MKPVIKAIDSQDVVENKGIEKFDIVIGVEINDKTQNLTVGASLNNKKGTFSIGVKWNMDAITGDDVTDSATLVTLNSMLMLVRDKCLAWKYDWAKNRSGDDPAQTKMFEDAEVEEDSLQVGFPAEQS